MGLAELDPTPLVLDDPDEPDLEPDLEADLEPSNEGQAFADDELEWLDELDDTELDGVATFLANAEAG